MEDEFEPYMLFTLRSFFVTEYKDSRRTDRLSKPPAPFVADSSGIHLLPPLFCHTRNDRLFVSA